MHADRLAQKGRALNGRGRACAARKAAMHGADPFATSPALLQSAALGAAVCCHPNPGLARSSQRPGLSPAARWAAKHPSTAHGMRRPRHARFAPASAIPPISTIPSGSGIRVNPCHPWLKIDSLHSPFGLTAFVCLAVLAPALNHGLHDQHGSIQRQPFFSSFPSFGHPLRLRHPCQSVPIRGLKRMPWTPFWPSATGCTPSVA